MPLAALTGRACDRLVALLGKVASRPRECVHVGGRDWDTGERERTQAAGIRVLRSPPRRIPRASHVHIDVDCLHRLADVPNVTHPSRGGIPARDLEGFLLSNAMRITSLSLSAWRVETEPPRAVI
ncbi:MAG: hypothetical protein NTY19_08085 [Planctomycetota bacterium]|nr:hypothetical protein [Planctomycetota bacterium]